MPIELAISPHGRPLVEAAGDVASAERRTSAMFAAGPAQGLLHLATADLTAKLAPGLAFAREWGRAYLTKLCQTPGVTEAVDPPRIPPPDAETRIAAAAAVPAIRGSEFITPEVLADWWTGLDALVRMEIRNTQGGAEAFLRSKNPAWRMVGRVTFHLAENKRDTEYPFAFLATYAGKMSAGGKPVQQPLGQAMTEYAGDRQALLSLLAPVNRAAQTLEWVRRMSNAGDLYHPLRWTPKQAYPLLRDLKELEAAGVIVQVPNWWKSDKPPRPVVSVQVNAKDQKSRVGVDALLDFRVGVTLDGDTLTVDELHELQTATDGLVLLRDKWVEVDREQLDAALAQWGQVQRQSEEEGMSFFEGMRLLSGAPLAGDAAASAVAIAPQWTGIAAGPALQKTLAELRDPADEDAPPPGLKGDLRPYQRAGVSWLRFAARLGLGACLADDMGLGKTIQVLSLLLHEKKRGGEPKTSLIVMPASLIGNWRAEAERFAPDLTLRVIHPSEKPAPAGAPEPDLILTTYGVLARTPELRERKWRLAILDEAQAIKNAGTRQSQAVKELKASSRIALTGTPVENRPSDLWSLFDFLNPGLLGSARAFASFVKKTAGDDDDARQTKTNKYAALRSLVRPYVLRRTKTDKKVIADLPDKSEVNAYCGMTKQQVLLYEKVVGELADAVSKAQGIGRRGLVLASLLRLKQVCNHPSQLLGDGKFDPADSGKFHRLGEIAAELADRQEKPLVFTQFRAMVDPLHDFLAKIFGRPGLTLHGGTAVKDRRDLVDSFQRDEGPPFFVLSLKAGGTGLNLTAASHVIHFDRWWNPAVENQATDRAFRIGQKKNVLVHKFVCKGTVEEKIDALIADKVGLARDLMSDGEGDSMLTELNDADLLKMVALDVNKAMETA
jgi:non-specific serine/threonine protein kinase